MSDAEHARRTLRWVVKQAMRAAVALFEAEAAMNLERAEEAARCADELRQWLR